MESGPILTLRDVTRRYGPREVVRQAGFALQPGRITCLLGPSGCGKSTILRMVAGLEPLDEGDIAIRGQAVSSPGLTTPPEQRGVGLVFQDNALFPHLNVRENVGFGVQSLGKAARQALVDDLLARLHVEHLADKWPHTLSGGEQQRVAIARALAREPVLLLLDEPFSGLDGHLRAQIRRSLMLDLQAVGTTVLAVTHDPDEAMAIADDLILMADGMILQTGSPAECYNRPASLVAARLLGDALEVPAKVRGAIAATPFGPVPADSICRAGTLILRPRDLVIAAEGIPATVMELRQIGHETRATVESELGQFSIDAGSANVEAGQAIHLRLRESARSLPQAGA